MILFYRFLTWLPYQLDLKQDITVFVGRRIASVGSQHSDFETFCTKQIFKTDDGYEIALSIRDPNLRLAEIEPPAEHVGELLPKALITKAYLDWFSNAHCCLTFNLQSDRQCMSIAFYVSAVGFIKNPNDANLHVEFYKKGEHSYL
jgi:hypothetical protein